MAAPAEAEAATWRHDAHKKLRPWITTLRERARIYRLDYELNIRMKAVRLVDFRLFEAIKLVVLAGLVDAPLWGRLVQELCSSESEPEGSAGHSRVHVLPVTCAMDIDHRPGSTLIVDWCGTAIEDPVSESTEYGDMKKLLEERPRARTKHVSTQVKIPLCISVMASGDEVRKQLALVATQQRHRASSPATGERESPFCEPQFWLIHSWLIVTDVTSLTQLQQFAQILAGGVSLHSLWLHELVIDLASAAAVATSLQTAMSTTTLSAEAVESGWIEELSITRQTPQQTITALFSALRTSQKVKRLHVDFDGVRRTDGPEVTIEGRKRLWQWIAFSVFSPHASHELETLSMNAATLTDDDIQALCDTLERPETLFVGRAPTISNQIVRIAPYQVLATRFQLADPLTGTGEVVEVPLQRVIVLESPDNIAGSCWLQVLLPGYGQAWVHQDDVQADAPSIRTELTTRRSRFGIKLSSLKASSLAPTLRLLRTIGHQISELSLCQFSYAAPLDDWLLDVVAACPKLKRLVLVGGVWLKSLDVFAQLYETGTLQAISLTLMEVTVDDQLSIPRLLLSLGDQSHAMATCLEKVVICARAVRSRFPGILSALDNMLSANQQLKEVAFQLEYVTGVQPDGAREVRKLKEKHADKPVNRPREPLDNRVKVAFLSVVAATDDLRKRRRTERADRVARVLNKLDPPVISLIFEFAAECATRRLNFRFRTEDGEEDDEYFHPRHDSSDEDVIIRHQYGESSCEEEENDAEESDDSDSSELEAVEANEVVAPDISSGDDSEEEEDDDSSEEDWDY